MRCTLPKPPSIAAAVPRKRGGRGGVREDEPGRRGPGRCMFERDLRRSARPCSQIRRVRAVSPVKGSVCACVWSGPSPGTPGKTPISSEAVLQRNVASTRGELAGSSQPASRSLVGTDGGGEQRNGSASIPCQERSGTSCSPSACGPTASSLPALALVLLRQRSKWNGRRGRVNPGPEVARRSDSLGRGVTNNGMGRASAPRRLICGDPPESSSSSHSCSPSERNVPNSSTHTPNPTCRAPSTSLN